LAALHPDLRNLLDKSVVRARAEAERATAAALQRYAVAQDRPYASHSEKQRKRRVALRENARQLGNQDLRQGLQLLAEEVAFEHWHHMLFARFLAENDLLMHPDGVAVTLEECTDLAVKQGELDGWAIAIRFAANMLPGIFSNDDPDMDLPIARESREALESILNSLPPEVFTSDDSLGWVYQFWQSKKKKDVSSGSKKIEGLDLAAYSQTFTENYMVRFLLENSIGAWWAIRHPGSPLLAEWKFLRRNDDGTLEAGGFSDWPKTASEVTVMDPCCGSGHFLVAAFDMLSRMRMEDEGLSQSEAGDAVLRENLFGLEIDPRCVQIAAFALALTAWKSGGYRPLPLPNVACSGTPLSGSVNEWTQLAGNDPDLRFELQNLHSLFRNAPDIGSLINPNLATPEHRMFKPDFARVSTLLSEALAKETAIEDPVAAVFGRIAEGAVRAADFLGRTYTLVATNVPYLGRSKQGETLKSFLSTHHPHAKADIATAFLDRCMAFSVQGGTCAVVTPQNWLFLKSYQAFREHMLKDVQWEWLCRLGPKAFETITGHVVKAILLVVTRKQPKAENLIRGVDTVRASSAIQKSMLARKLPVQSVLQSRQLVHPDSRVSFDDLGEGPFLSAFATSYQGFITGDAARFRRYFWEVAPSTRNRWRNFQSSVSESRPVGGLEFVVDWSNEGSDFARLQGLRAVGQSGVAVSTGNRAVTFFAGYLYDSSTAAVIPKNPNHLPAIWNFLKSKEYRDAVSALDAKIHVTNATLTKVPFDLVRWQAEANRAGAMPELSTGDLTQWEFPGVLPESTDPLQVAVARLVGYRWPHQVDDEAFNQCVDEDGLLPLVPIAGEEPASEKLRSILATAYGRNWNARTHDELLRAAKFGGRNLHAWLIDGFFEQHAQIFRQRPFIWHIWDGRRDGFSVLANYHKLNAARLNKVIYTHLGDWIRAQRADQQAGLPGAGARLLAALKLQDKLQSIRDGEPPYDIFVRWKPLAEQPMGWNPDLNDGIRLNIRPFVEAGVLRRRINVTWGKDRGLNSDGTERLNNLNFSIAEKRQARLSATN
jgi:hypothetical protein